MVNFTRYLPKILLHLFILATAICAPLLREGHALAEEEEPTNDEAQKWLAEATEKLLLLAERKVLPIRVLVVTAINKKDGVDFMKIDAPLFNRLGMFRLGDSTNLAWSLLLNKAARSKAKKGPPDITRDFYNIFGVSGADLIAFVPESPGAAWSLMIDDGKEIRTVAAAPRSPKMNDIGKIYNWIQESLGYNGVILGQRQDLFLVVGRPENLHQDAQAVVLGESANKISIDQGEKAGTALLKLVQASGMFAIFKLTFQKPGKPGPNIGDKLSISK
jgi:hypothetical protein